MESVLGEITTEFLKQLALTQFGIRRFAKYLNLITTIQPMIKEIMDSGVELPAHHQAQIDMLYTIIKNGKELFEKFNSCSRWNMFEYLTLSGRIAKFDEEFKLFVKSPILTNILIDIHRLQADSDMHSDHVDESLGGGGMIKDPMKLAEATTKIESNDVSANRGEMSNFLKVPIPRKLANIVDSIELAKATMGIKANNMYHFEEVETRLELGKEVIEEWEFQYGPLRFSYEELSIATNEFEEKQLLGKGGFGQVYKGKLRGSHAKIAVKRTSHNSKQGMSEFLAEISTIGYLRHPNLVRLLGYCKHKEELFLVYDYMPNGSLDKYISQNGNQEQLTWEQRFKIIKDIASALLYMHQEWKQVIIHRDIKPANVLIDHEMNARLGDFGLAKLYDHGFDPQTSKVAGTFGYMAPEFFRTGRATTNIDVYAFGVVMLEVVCGRRLFEKHAKKSEEVLGDWILDLWEKGDVIDAAEESIRQEENKEQIKLVLKLGVSCSHQTVSNRPDMSKVMEVLNGDSELPDNLLDVLRREKFRGRHEISPTEMLLDLNSLGTSTSDTETFYSCIEHPN